MKEFSINITQLEFGCRLLPSYYYYSTIIKKHLLDKGIRLIKLGDISQLISDGEHSQIKRQKEKGVRYLYGRNIKEGIINFDPISDYPYISNDDYERFKRCHIRDNDILVTIYGTIGKSAIYKKNYVGIAGIPRHISNIRLRNGSVLTNEYITALFRSKFGKRQIYNLSTGNIQQLLALKNIKKIDLPVPSIEVISRISTKEAKAIDYEMQAFKLIDQAKDMFYQCLDLELSKMEFGKIFSTRLSSINGDGLMTPAYSYPLYANAMSAIKQKWKTVKICDIGSVKRGDEPGSDNYVEYIDRKIGDIPFIRTSDFVNNDIDLFTDNFVSKEVYTDLNQDLQEGDILFTNDGKIGSAAILSSVDKVVIQSHIRRIRLHRKAEKINLNAYYVFLLLTIKEIGLFQAKRFTVIQSTIPTISSNLEKFEIPLLNQSSMNEISSIVEKAVELRRLRKELLLDITDELDKLYS